ncbi:hypothetical protein [Antarcticimicrobium luteum]|uniref:Uncharacterized protein n=1 Tax=Antarcticimicrobium luteum TaxID=2547397 RepID=A0A4R5UZZ0_9RHOB|nr:hypothetical protein [Antarcticimicrobium luteum]TDK44999.1 hypothetical protein E1832_14070 [Antarcticimicrobium luteum]
MRQTVGWRGNAGSMHFIAAKSGQHQSRAPTSTKRQTMGTVRRLRGALRACSAQREIGSEVG